MRRCVLREGEVYDLSADVGRLCEGGVSPGELRDALLDMRAALGAFKRGPGGVVIDTPRPDVVGRKAFSGFWVGVYRHRGGVEVLVEPRVGRYHRMVERAEEALRGAFPLYLLSRGLVASNVPNLALVLRVLWEARWLILREPRYFRVSVEWGRGRLVVKGGREALVKSVAVPNVWLASAVILALGGLAGHVREARRYVAELLRGVEGVGEVLSRYLDSLGRAVETLAGDVEGDLPHLWVEDLDPGEYWHLPAAARRAGAEFVLVPSTKLYELYVLAVTAMGVGGGGVVARLGGGVALDVVGDGSLYFNRAPASRIIGKIAARRPRPDIVLWSGEKRIVVEAKYRDLSRRRLMLGDAVRLVAYLADVAKNDKLRGVVAALSIPSGGRCPSIPAQIGRRGLEVRFARLNPEDEASEEAYKSCIREILEG